MSICLLRCDAQHPFGGSHRIRTAWRNADEFGTDGTRINAKRSCFQQESTLRSDIRPEIAEAKKRGIKIVITLREQDEVDWDEAATVRGLGLEFHRFGFQPPESSLTNEIIEKSLKILAESKSNPVVSD